MRTIDGKPEYRNGLVSDGVWGATPSGSSHQLRRSSVILGVPFQLGVFPEIHVILRRCPIMLGSFPGLLGRLPIIWGEGGGIPVIFVKFLIVLGGFPITLRVSTLFQGFPSF